MGMLVRLIVRHIGLIVIIIYGLISTGEKGSGREAGCDVVSPKVEAENNEPAAHLTDKHLGSVGGPVSQGKDSIGFYLVYLRREYWGNGIRTFGRQVARRPSA